MYCYKCGKELREDARFCPVCGASVAHGQEGEKCASSTPTEKERFCQPSNQPPDKPSLVTQRKNRKRPVLWCISIVFLLVGVAIGGYMISRETGYKNAVASAASLIAERRFDEAIEELKDAIHLKPSIADNYLSLATAYVESGDLFSAKEILASGYATTQNTSLHDVKIWGPVLELETMFWGNMLEEIPITRQEYHFTIDAPIQGYVSAFGKVIIINSYYFDEIGNLSHSTYTSLDGRYPFGGGEKEILESGRWMEILTPPDWIFDYSYDEFGHITSAYAEDANGFSFTIFAQYPSPEEVIVQIQGKEGYIQYAGDGRPSRVVLPHGFQYTAAYREDGSWSMTPSQGDYRFEFNSDGYFAALLGDSRYTNFTTEFDAQGRVISVSIDDMLAYSYDYSGDGYLVEAKQYHAGEEVYSVKCSYDNAGYMTQIDYYLSGHTSNIEYNESGNIIKIVKSDESGETLSELKATYDASGKQLLSYASYHHVETNLAVIYYTPQYNEYGALEDVPSRWANCTYIPGTYTGVAKGFGGNITVSVTVDYDQITQITVDAQSETAGVGTGAFDPTITAIIAENSTDVDAVTGATITSKGVIAAVENALENKKTEKSAEEEATEFAISMARNNGMTSYDSTNPICGVWDWSSDDSDFGNTIWCIWPDGTFDAYINADDGYPLDRAYIGEIAYSGKWSYDGNSLSINTSAVDSETDPTMIEIIWHGNNAFELVPEYSADYRAYRIIYNVPDNNSSQLFN